jgi:hypothetical protein
MGLALGTKITVGLTIPLFLYLFLIKKDFRGMLGFILLAFLTFEITNPLSLIFLNDFIFRIYSMFTKEGGLVFDSVDSNPFKYILALGYMVTPLIIISSVYGIYLSLKNKTEKPFNIFNRSYSILFDLLFYTIKAGR